MPLKHAVFTVMMPEFDLVETVSLLKSFGYDGVEWRIHSVPTDPNAAPDFWRSNKSTVAIETIVEKAEEVRKMTEDNGIEIFALGTYLNYKMVDDIKRCMEAAKIMGAGSIRVGVPKYNGSENYNDLFEEASEGFATVEDLAKDYGVRANIEIHPRNICCSASLAYKLVSEFDPDYIGVIHDAGNMITEGFENWQLGLELLGPYLSHLHVKNAGWSCEETESGEKVWRVVRTGLREGCVSWRNVIAALNAVGYHGWMSLEDFSQGDTKKKLADNIAYLKSLEAEIGI